jgi:hypothetical protein
VIPVAQRGAPRGFNKKVYRPGRRWLRAEGLPLSGPLPPQAKPLSPYWRRILPELHRRYSGVCAYVCVYIEVVTGGRSADHYIAKSRALEEAYRWRNYRLAATRMNSRKCDYTDVLDPFAIAAETFHIELAIGRIFPNPGLDPVTLKRAQDTIDRLGLDDEDCRRTRRDYFEDYRTHHIDDDYLKRKCPFVWLEVHRQGLTV